MVGRGLIRTGSRFSVRTLLWRFGLQNSKEIYYLPNIMEGTGTCTGAGIIGSGSAFWETSLDKLKMLR